MRKRIWVRAFFLSVLQLAAAQPSGAEEMAHRLQRIARQARERVPSDLNTFNLNQASAAYLRVQLAEAPSRHRRLLLGLQLSTQLLRAGQTREAIAALLQVKDQAAGQPLPPGFARRLRDRFGIAYLRLGEEENCLLNHTIESCLLPIGGKGVHTQPEGSRQALAQYAAALEADSTDLGARWLLNIAHMTLGQYPDQVPPQWLVPPQVFRSDYDIKRFRDVAPQLGLDVVARSGGSIVEDFNNDGFLDVVASSWGLLDPLRYFRNNGDGTFKDLTDTAGLSGQVGGLNICQADYDNDGFRDILVLRGAWLGRYGHHPNSLLRNNGDSTFTDVTDDAGLLSFHPTQTAAWADFDNDGWLDLFVGNESDAWERHACQLYRNNGDGTFTDVAADLGVDNVGFLKGAVWGDYDNDGFIDLYLSRLQQANVLYRNLGPAHGWRFEDVGPAAGVTEPLGSFPAWFWDYDNDGWLDLFVGAYYNESVDDIAAVYLGRLGAAERPRLYRNNGDGTFADLTADTGLEDVILAMGANFGDLDNDGWLDCYIGTGNPDLRSLLPNRMLRNNGGRSFQDVTTSGGFGHIQKGHGISFGDLDNDGDQDIHAVMGGAYPGDVYQNLLYENPGHGNRWITLRLEGTTSNRDAVGARVRIRAVTDGSLRDIYATVGSGGSFGASSLQQEIGLGQAEAIRSIEITWPASGRTQTFSGVDMDQILRIRENEARPLRLDQRPFSLSSGTGHHHRHLKTRD